MLRSKVSERSVNSMLSSERRLGVVPYVFDAADLNTNDNTKL